MPTEGYENEKKELFIILDDDKTAKAVGTIEKIEAQCDSDDAADSIAAYVENKKEHTITIPIEYTKSIAKLLGINRITRKRFKKLLMGYEVPRNVAEIIARAFQKKGIPYTPLAVEKVLETIIKEIEKEENK